MKIKIDENLPVALKEVLKVHGMDVHTVYDENIQGVTDFQLLNISKKENRILITLDLDFSNITNYSPKEYSGIIILRPNQQDIKSLIRLAEKIVPYIQSESILGKLWIVDQNKIRIRGGEN